MRKGKNNSNWRGGRIILTTGYIGILKPNHPRAINGYVSEHILIMEEVLMRSLILGEEIHHIDGNKTNNDKNNLTLFNSRAEHQKFHEELIAFKVCGHYSWRKCKYCHTYDAPENLITNKNSYHLCCDRKAARERYRNNHTVNESDYKQLNDGCPHIIYKNGLNKNGLERNKKVSFTDEELQEVINFA